MLKKSILCVMAILTCQPFLYSYCDTESPNWIRWAGNLENFTIINDTNHEAIITFSNREPQKVTPGTTAMIAVAKIVDPDPNYPHYPFYAGNNDVQFVHVNCNGQKRMYAYTPRIYVRGAIETCDWRSIDIRISALFPAQQ